MLRGRGVVLLQHAADLREFLEEVALGVQAAGGVAQEEVGAGAAGEVVGLEADGGGVAIRGAIDHGDAEALGPHLELLDGGGAEGVGGGEHDLASLVMEELGELGGGGGLAGAIDADDEHHLRPALKRCEGCDLRGQDPAHMLARDLHDVGPVELAPLGFEVVHDPHGQPRPQVSGDEHGLEFVPVNIGFREALEEGFEKAGHESVCGRFA